MRTETKETFNGKPMVMVKKTGTIGGKPYVTNRVTLDGKLHHQRTLIVGSTARDKSTTNGKVTKLKSRYGVTPGGRHYGAVASKVGRRVVVTSSGRKNATEYEKATASGEKPVKTFRRGKASSNPEPKVVAKGPTKKLLKNQRESHPFGLQRRNKLV